MWWDSNILKVVAIWGVFIIASLIWTVVMLFKRDGHAIAGLLLLICFGMVPFVMIRDHIAEPVVSDRQVMPDGRLRVKDYTRHCYENIVKTEVFTTIIDPKAQLSVFDTCIICGNTLFDHYRKQLSDAQIYARSILPSTPGE